MRTLCAGSILTLAAALPLAGLADEAGRWYINPAVGLQNFDSDRRQKDEPTGILGLEYRFGQHWATELRYMRSSLDPKGGGSSVDLDQLHLDGLYYLGTFGKFEPYLAFGVGHARFDYDRKHEETQINAGAGVRYNFTQNWSARADLRGINGLDSENTDSLVSLGISYAFGGGRTAPAQPAPAQDSDGDGIDDDRDLCPDTPRGVGVDQDGCPLDSDNDGVPDYLDECPNTEVGREVDERGCHYELTETVELDLSINFALNSSEVPESFMAEVERAAQFLRRYADVEAEIEGHTDNTGETSYNQRLSEQRANAVRDLLVDRYGIDASRLKVVGYGEERPLASNDTADGRLANRRVVAVMKAQVTK